VKVFLIRKKIDGYLVKRLAVVILFTALTASAGWIMVKSGLVDRPWVDAYKLSLHFILAVLSISALVKTIADVYGYRVKRKHVRNKAILKFLIVISFVQLIFAGIMSGMKAGLYYPTWPDMNGEFIPAVLKSSSNWTLENLTNYDSFVFAPAFIQFAHRFLAYVILLITIVLFFKWKSSLLELSRKWLNITFALILLQVTLGVLTLLNIKTGIPLFYGVAHQLVGILFFMSLLFLFYSLRNRKV